MVHLRFIIEREKRRQFCLLVFVLFEVNCFSQQFSTRLGTYYSSQIDHVLIAANNYIVIGNAVDTSGFTKSTLLVGSIDLNGQVNFENQLYSANWDLDAIVDANTQLNDSTFIVGCPLTFDGNDTLFTGLLWLDSHGDTIRTRRYFSPYYYQNNDPENLSYWMITTSICANPDGQNIYMASQIVDYPPIENGFIVKKLTASGEEVWTYQYPISPTYYGCNVIQYFNGKIYCLIGGPSGSNFDKLIEIDDSTGLMLNETVVDASAFPLYSARDMVLDETGISVACLRTQIGEGRLPGIYHSDFEGNYIWSNSMGSTFNFGNNNDHIAQAQDGGFVCCSEKKEYHLIGNEGNDESSIWLWKVDANGVLQWERQYEYFTVDSGYWSLYNIAHDFKATPDGGFICAGEATAMCTDYPACDHSTQQGWLLKVDGCGCLVPGCDENCIVPVDEITADNALKFFKVGPNPARDDFYVYLSGMDLSMQQLTLSCMDSNGKLVKNFPVKHGDTTYVIDVRSLPSGTYYLKLSNTDRVLQTERVSVVR